MSKKRSIFEDVGSDVKPEMVMPKTGVIDAAPKGARGGIRIWLVIIFALVVLMVLVGGMTRLTDSGLSITEWKPVTGAIPPLNDADWAREFAKYQTSPEFQIQNSAMTVTEFKSIYWWEWGHRQLGRFVGVVWAVGFLFFWLTKRIPTGWTPRLVGLGVLGGLQGAIGWWMVSSGLTGRMVDVASYRLATHLGLAFIILGLTAWYIFLMSRKDADLMAARRGGEAKLFSMSTGLMHLAFLQILLGALVAGIDAGRGYTDWPLMGGQVIPDGLFDYVPWWSNLFENPALVQFIHRLFGYLVFVFAIVVWRRSRSSGNRKTKAAFNMMISMVLLQVVLGITTVMLAAQMHVALTHQAGAILLWVMIIRTRFLAGYPVAQSVRGK
ncbi:MAG: COX15/CtaA family protein [Marinosulfonomonas sp.]|nr:COX15/CtaA family protein [Marinosulfonomonas sp.]